MLPSSANDSADGSTAAIPSADSTGRCGASSELGMPPNRVPMVSTGRPSSQAATAADATAISIAGQCGRQRRSAAMRPIVTAESAAAGMLKLGSASPRAASFGMSGPGSLASVRPSRSLSWLARMMTAMPAVNPTVTGKGMYLMNVPSRSSPMARMMAPLSMVASSRPSMPCR